jgi:hypothetical protein
VAVRVIEVGVGDHGLARGGHVLDLADLHPALQDLRAADLPRLRASGPLGKLLARQGEAYVGSLPPAIRMGRIAVRPEQVVVLDFETRFPTAVSLLGSA